MSLISWSASDLITAIEIAQSIWETWFNKFRRADAQYLDFGKDIAQFGRLLERFSTIFENAAQTRGRQLSASDFREWNTQTYRERQEVVGSFTRTLEECYRLLEQNAKYLSKTQQAWDNATWHLGGGGDSAERLRKRLQFHAAKMNLLADFNTNATAGAVHVTIGNLPAQIYRQLNQGADMRLPPVPPALDERYTQALNIAPPPTYYGLDQFPLCEGLDAFIAAYESSTVKSPASRSSLRVWLPSMEEMNNLIKARWIFDRIWESSLLRSCSPHSVWACALEAAVKNLQEEYGRWHQVLDQNTQAISSLNPEFFRIWPPTETLQVQLVTDPDEVQMEDKIFEAPLRSSSTQFKKDLVVFKRPGTEYRVLTYTSLNLAGGDTSIHDENKVLGVHTAQVIPRYALPPYGQNLPDTSDFEVCLPGASSGDLYTFLNQDDRYTFQQALLGYKVVFQDTCNWQLHLSRLKGKMGGPGLVQIFQAKPLQSSNSSQAIAGSTSNNLSRNDSIFSQGSTSTKSSQASAQASNLRSNGSVIAEYPHAPLMVIFTKINGQLTFLRIPLTHDVHVLPKRCDCGSDSEARRKNCHYTVLESSTKFSVQRFSAPAESKWNLALLGLPQHPEFDKEVENVKHVNYITIQSTVPASEFQKTIHTMMLIRNYKHHEFENGRRVARAASDRPATDALSTLSVSKAKRRESSNVAPSFMPSGFPSELDGNSYTVVSPIQGGPGGLTLSERPVSFSSTSMLSSELEGASVFSSELEDTSNPSFGRFELGTTR